MVNNQEIGMEQTKKRCSFNSSTGEAITPIESISVADGIPPTGYGLHTHGGMADIPPPNWTLLWNDLQQLRQEIQHWRYAGEYEDLPSAIWDLWDHHRRAGTEDIFLEVIQGEIVEGEKFNQRLMNMMAKGLGQRRDFMEWATEAGELFSKVHQSIEALKVRLKMVESGLVEKYPDALHPYHH